VRMAFDNKVMSASDNAVYASPASSGASRRFPAE
jgi:hypothetical protein